MIKKTLTGGLRLQNPLWLAPLAGVTTPPLREFFSFLGAGLVHTEMVSCNGLVRNNKKTEGMLQILPSEAPVVLQLFGSEEGVAAQSAEEALRINPSFAALGVNMACPMPKVTKRGAGSAMMDTPDKAFKMVQALNIFERPIWVKIRRLPSGDKAETLRFIEGLLRAGAQNICIHGRTPAQRYEGRADREIVALAAKIFPGFISASGDVYQIEDIQEYLSMGCVGVMLARGALANPYLFPRALAALGYVVAEDLLNPTPVQQLARLTSLGERARMLSGSRLAVVLLKRLMGGMLKGIHGAADLRRRAGSAIDLDELLGCFAEGIRPLEYNGQDRNR